MRKIVVGVMGGGSASAEVVDAAYRLGTLIARQGWVLLNGGRVAGVMDASARGARAEQGLTVGILPGRDLEGMSDAIDIPIVTGMGDGRNSINVLSSDVVIACAGGAGTLSEVALALKSGRDVILLDVGSEGRGRGDEIAALLGPSEGSRLHQVFTPEDAVDAARRIVGRSGRAKENGKRG